MSMLIHNINEMLMRYYKRSNQNLPYVLEYRPDHEADDQVSSAWCGSTCAARPWRHRNACSRDARTSVSKLCTPPAARFSEIQWSATLHQFDAMVRYPESDPPESGKVTTQTYQTTEWVKFLRLLNLSI